MNYFEFYPGDYLRGTARLSLAEHGAYLLLMADYYASEKPLPADVSALCRIVGAQGSLEQRAVKAIADQYFPVGDDGLRHNSRADREIAKAQRRINTARENGSKGGRKAKPTVDAKAEAKHTPQETQRDTQWVPRQDTQRGTHSGEALHTPHARPQEILQASLGTDSSLGLDTHRASARAQPLADRITAGEACKAMREGGIATTSPAHPELQALVDAGATRPQFAYAARVAVSKGKGFGYALGVLKGQLADAVAAPKPGRADPEALQVQNRSIAAAWLAEGETA